MNAWPGVFRAALFKARRLVTRVCVPPLSLHEAKVEA
jgi:hypothetical protein